MSQDNVEVVSQLLAAVTRRDVSRLVDLTDPDVEWRSFFAALSEEGGRYRGHDGIRQYIADVSEAFETMRVEVGDLLDVGETIVGIGRIYYKGQGSGIEADTPAGWVFRFRDGKVIYFHAFRDPEKVFATVGLEA
jgi:ketosteroid isomerase-like protein